MSSCKKTARRQIWLSSAGKLAGALDIYGKNMFAREDFARLAEIQAGLKGKFLLSLGDHPEVRRIFAGFEMQELEVTYTVSMKASKSKGKELLISAA